MSRRRGKKPDLPAQLSLFKSRASTVKNIQKAFDYVEKNLMGIKVAGTNISRVDKHVLKHNGETVYEIPYFKYDIYHVPDNDPDKRNKLKIRDKKIIKYELIHENSGICMDKGGYKLKNINDNGNYGDYEELPDIEIIKKEGISSSGLIQLMRLSVGLKIDNFSCDIERGSGKFWLTYFIRKKVLQEYYITKNYPHGTLLISGKEPHHMVVVYKKKETPFQFMHSKVLHAYVDDKHPTGGQVGETVLMYIDTVQNNEVINGSTTSTYFDFAVLPDDWLSTDENDNNMVIFGMEKRDKYDVYRERFKLLNGLDRRNDEKALFNKIYNNSKPEGNINDIRDNDYKTKIRKLRRLLHKSRNGIEQIYTVRYMDNYNIKRILDGYDKEDYTYNLRDKSYKSLQELLNADNMKYYRNHGVYRAPTDEDLLDCLKSDKCILPDNDSDVNGDKKTNKLSRTLKVSDIKEMVGAHIDIDIPDDISDLYLEEDIIDFASSNDEEEKPSKKKVPPSPSDSDDDSDNDDSSIRSISKFDIADIEIESDDSDSD